MVAARSLRAGFWHLGKSGSERHLQPVTFLVSLLGASSMVPRQGQGKASEERGDRVTYLFSLLASYRGDGS